MHMLLFCIAYWIIGMVFAVAIHINPALDHTKYPIERLPNEELTTESVLFDIVMWPVYAGFLVFAALGVVAIFIFSILTLPVKLAVELRRLWITHYVNKE